jgi:hypothetical protein
MLARDIPTSSNIFAAEIPTLTGEVLRFLLRAISPFKQAGDPGLTPAPTSRREVWVTDFGSPPGEATADFIGFLSCQLRLFFLKM